MTSTLRPTNSVAISLYRSERPPAQRNAIATFGDALEKRRALMEAWAAYCEPKAGNVVSIARRPH
jgi:hypothetical protein